MDSTKDTANSSPAPANPPREQQQAPQQAASSATLGGVQLPPGFRPRHTLKDDVNPAGYNLLKLYADTPEGAAYEALATDAERLAYMRAHHHDSVRHVEATERVFEHWDELRRYVVVDDSPEGRALAALDGPWRDADDPDCDEARAFVKHYKENASYVEVLRPADRPDDC